MVFNFDLLRTGISSILFLESLPPPRQPPSSRRLSAWTFLDTSIKLSCLFRVKNSLLLLVYGDPTFSGLVKDPAAESMTHPTRQRIVLVNN